MLDSTVKIQSKMADCKGYWRTTINRLHEDLIKNQKVIFPLWKRQKCIKRISEKEDRNESGSNLLRSRSSANLPEYQWMENTSDFRTPSPWSHSNSAATDQKNVSPFIREECFTFKSTSPFSPPELWFPPQFRKESWSKENETKHKLPTKFILLICSLYSILITHCYIL